MELGYDGQSVDLGVLDTTILGFDFLQFSQNSSAYESIDDLGVYVTDEKCQLTTEFTEYNIFSGGITIPIIIDISKCRPI